MAALTNTRLMSARVHRQPGCLLRPGCQRVTLNPPHTKGWGGDAQGGDSGRDGRRGGRYVGVAPQPEDAEPFHAKMTRLAAEWREQQKEARRLDRRIAKNLAALGFGPGKE